MVEWLKFSLALVVCAMPNFPRIKFYSNFIKRLRARTIGLGARRDVGRYVRVGSGFSFPRGLSLKIDDHCTIGDDVTLKAHRFNSAEGYFEMGKRSCLQSGVTIDTSGKFFMAQDSCVGEKCVIHTHSHDISRKETLVQKSSEIYGPVRIGENAMIFSDTVILAGATIEDGAIVGTRSLVTSRLREYGIYAGSPARKIKNRD